MQTNQIQSIYLTGGKLEAYLSCPYKYYLANIRKLTNNTFKKSPILAFDQIIHKTLANYYKFHKKEDAFSFPELLKSLNYNWKSFEFNSQEESNSQKELAANILKTYFDNFCNQKDLHIETDNFFKTKINNIDYGGKIDRIDELQDSTIELIDYKTGKYTQETEKELENSISVQLLFQVADNQWPGRVNRLTYIYLKDNKTIYINRDQNKINSAVESFNQTVKNIIDNKFPAVYSNKCNWCDYKAICPEGKKTLLTVAKLKAFQDCPQKYSFKYIDRLSANNQEPKLALLFYNYITKMLFNIYKEKKQYSTEKLLLHANNALKGTNLPEELKENLIENCRKAFSYVNSTINEDKFPIIKDLNTELSFHSEDNVFTAKADRIDILPNGKYRIVIYKTGKQALTENELKNDISSALYYYIGNALYPNQIEYVSFIYVLANQTINFIPTPETLKYLDELIFSIKKEDAFDGNEGCLCSWCDYYVNCPKWKVKPNERANESLEEYRKRLRLSYSKMSLYLNCPRAYKKLYVDKIAPKPQPFFSFGTTIHETFEKIYDPANANLEKPTLEEVIKIFDEVRLHHREGYESVELENKYREDGIRQLTLYYKQFIENRDFKLANNIEKYFEIPCGKYAVMTGYIDRIDKLEDGTYEILDYKTEPTLRSQSEVDKDKQLSIYYWAAKETMGYNISKLSLLMLDHDLKIETTRTDEEISEVLKIIDNTAYSILNEKEFQPKKNKYCKSCEHLADCPLKSEILADSNLTSMQKFYEKDIVDFNNE